MAITFKGTGIRYTPLNNFTFLAQQFSTPAEVWATTKENSIYSGPAFRAQRADNSASFDIPFTDGKHADPSYASNFAGTTALVSIVYGQVNGLNATQSTVANMMKAYIDTDGYWTFGTDVNQSNVGNPPKTNLVVADNALLRPANPHIFCTLRPGFMENTATGSAPPFNGTGVVITYSGTGDAATVGRYGFGTDTQGGLGIWVCQNGTVGTAIDGCLQWTIGEAHCQNWHVWDLSASTLECRFDGSEKTINPAGTNTTITYPANTQLNIGADASFTKTYTGNWRLIALYGTTRSDRNSISNYLMNNYTSVAALPPSYTDSDGFTYTPFYYPNGGGFLTPDSPDFYGINWYSEYGGYSYDLTNHANGPGFAVANNVNNSANLVRFAIQPYDNDVYVTGAQRCERGAYPPPPNSNVNIVPGQNMAIFAQFLIEPGSPQNGDWAYIFQVHTDSGSDPDIVTISILGDAFQIQTQKSGVTTNQGPSIPFSRGTWYALLYRITWSASGTADALQVYLSANGSTLTKQVDVSGSALWLLSAGGAYMKQGLYTGFPGHNPAIAMRIANQQSSNTLSAFDSFITTQPALPTHP